MSNFLQPTPYIDYEAGNIQWELNRFRIHQADPRKQMILLFDYVRDHIDTQTGLDSINPLKASETLTHGYGCCIAKANLLTAFARGVGIPARVGYVELKFRGKVNRHSMLGKCAKYHGIVSVLIDDQWMNLDPSCSAMYSKARNAYSAAFDGESNAMLPRYNRKNKVDIDVLSHRGFFVDVPDQVHAFFNKICYS